MNLKIAFILGSIFFVLGVITLPHYGINWDTINHLPRGQAYLRYLTTGKKDYSELQRYFHDWGSPDQWYWQNPNSLFIDTNIPRSKVPFRSMYQIDSYTYNEYINRDGDGHPPLSDILSSVFNRILFGKLRLINDIDSYRVYGIFLSACLVGLLYYWASREYGRIAGLFASLSLSIYPLFWAESHFNTEKDIPETVYWSFFLYCVYRGIHNKSIKWLLLSGIMFGLALGTKFNILFSVLAIFPWMLFLLIFRRINFATLTKSILGGVPAFIIGLVIFIGSWPYLWADPIARIQGVLNFYKGIGASGEKIINFYPLQWITYTTPLVILALFLIGFIIATYRVVKNKDDFSFLIILWLAVPILREVAPGASFYGGVRQIMEYIPAMAILAGLGAQTIYNKYNKKLTFVLLLLSFLPITLKLINIHPNENVYFNPLIGGLSGAKSVNLAYWGFSFGNAYRQGVIWLNKNAQKDSQIVYAYELIPNFPRLWLRPDLTLHNSFRSGYFRKGEYAITLKYQGLEKRSYYDMYLNKFLRPVYEVKVDGVAILSIWKNDDEHLLIPWKEQIVKNPALLLTDTGLKFDLGNIYSISRLEITYNDLNCKKLISGYLETSSDEKKWEKLPGVLPDDWRISAMGEQPQGGKFVEPFVGQSARYINISLTPEDTCLKNVSNFNIYAFTP